MRRYIPPRKYTHEELAIADMSDLAVDIVCARRDGHEDYAAECEHELAKLKAEFRATYDTEPVLYDYARA